MSSDRQPITSAQVWSSRARILPGLSYQTVQKSPIGKQSLPLTGGGTRFSTKRRPCRLRVSTQLTTSCVKLIIYCTGTSSFWACFGLTLACFGAGEKLSRYKLPESGAIAVSEMLERMVGDRTPNESEAASKSQLQEWLTEQIQGRFVGGRLELYGSTASGLGMKGADLDLCLCVAEGKERDACR